jgi:hypothetical protein
MMPKKVWRPLNTYGLVFIALCTGIVLGVTITAL